MIVCLEAIKIDFVEGIFSSIVDLMTSWPQKSAVFGSSTSNFIQNRVLLGLNNTQVHS